MDSPRPRVTVVLPCYNEAPHVVTELTRIRDGLDRSGIDYELLVVDDGSTDETAALLRRSQPDVPAMRVISLVANSGAGTARRVGTAAAQGEIVVWTDADMTYPNELIGDLVDVLDADPGCDQVIGARTSEQGSHARSRALVKWAIRALAQGLIRERIPDLNSGMRAFRRVTALPHLPLLPTGFSCVTTLTLAFLATGHPIRYVRITYGTRSGTSKFRVVPDTYRCLRQVLTVSLVYRPLRLLHLVLVAALALCCVVIGLAAYVGQWATPVGALLLTTAAAAGVLVDAARCSRSARRGVAAPGRTLQPRELEPGA